MRKHLLLIAASLALLASPAAADWTGKDASGATITFSNPVDCTSGTCIPIAALVTAAGGTLYGTAGSSNTAVLSVQGIASGTALPISGTVTATPTGTQAISAASASYASGAFSSGSFASGAVASGAFASGSIASGAMAAGSHAAGSGVDGWDLTQGAIADAAVTAGATGSVSAKLRSISRDVMTVNTWAGGTLGAMANYGTSPGAVPVPGVNAFVTNTLAPGQAAGGGSSPVVVAKNSGTGSTVAGAAVGTAGTPSAEVVSVQQPAADPCQTIANSTARGNITSATTARIITPSASNKTYICSVDLFSFAANNVGIYEGTGGTCGTGKAGVIGGTTTSTGISFDAKGGMVKGGAGFFVWNTAGTNVDFCLETSTAGPLAYFVKYVQAP